jgi:y4mF family transcriptional regulator
VKAIEMDPNNENPFDVERVTPLGAAVRRRRRELGLRQAEVAELAGCSQRFVHTVEQGKASLRLDKILEVLEVLGLGLELVPGRGRIVAAMYPADEGERE